MTCSNMFRSIVVALAAFSMAMSLAAQKVVVLYNQGQPGTMAPAQVMEQACAATTISCDDQQAFNELCGDGDYAELIAFDTFMEPEKLETLKEKLAGLDGATKLIVYVKGGDNAYNDVKCDEKHTIDFKAGSYLLPAMERAKLPATDGAQLLDNGLSHAPSEQGKALREYYVTYESSKEALFEIIEADAQELREILKSGQLFVDKMLSQTRVLLNTAKYETLENEIRVGFQLAATGVSTLAPAMLKTGNADVAIVLINSDPFSNVQRFSVRAAGNLSASKILEFIKSKVRVIRGGGNDVSAGFTCEASAGEIIAILRTASIDQLRR